MVSDASLRELEERVARAVARLGELSAERRRWAGSESSPGREAAVPDDVVTAVRGALAALRGE